MNKLNFKQRMKQAEKATRKAGQKWGKKAGNTVQDGIMAMDKMKEMFNK